MDSTAKMIRLGHIEYSNCVPLHFLLLEERSPDVRIVRAVPSQLNERLAVGSIDVAPCSSIELARHPDDYCVLPDAVIGADGPVHSILLESAHPLAALDDAIVAVPSASATSVVLLRILLELSAGVRARFEWFDQQTQPDPIAAGAAAALFIGDIALTRETAAGRHRYDLGDLWTQWTGLPFAFAIWQVRRAAIARPELRHVHAQLLAARTRFQRDPHALAARYAPSLGIEQERLVQYWETLNFTLDARMQRGLLHFYALAAQLGEATPLQTLPWAFPASP